MAVLLPGPSQRITPQSGPIKITKGADPQGNIGGGEQQPMVAPPLPSQDQTTDQTVNGPVQNQDRNQMMANRDTGAMFADATTGRTDDFRASRYGKILDDFIASMRSKQ